MANDGKTMISRTPKEPVENIKITVLYQTNQVHNDNRLSHLTTYRRDTNFSGNLSEAIKLFDWAGE